MDSDGKGIRGELGLRGGSGCEKIGYWDKANERVGLTRGASERQDFEGSALPAEYGYSQPASRRESSPLERRRPLVCSVYLIGVHVIENR